MAAGEERGNSIRALKPYLVGYDPLQLGTALLEKSGVCETSCGLDLTTLVEPMGVTTGFQDIQKSLTSRRVLLTLKPLRFLPVSNVITQRQSKTSVVAF